MRLNQDTGQLDGSFSIAFIGYYREQTDANFKQFYYDNYDDIDGKDFKLGLIRFKDGTEVYKIYDNDRRTCGKRFDQIIISDDERKMINKDKHDFINLVMSQFNTFCVPEELFIMEYIV